MSTDMQPNSNPLTHYQREKIEQVAIANARSLSTPQLRLVRATIADLLATELSLPIEEMYQIRGRVVHTEIQARESPNPSLRVMLRKCILNLGTGAWCERALVHDRTLP